MSLRIPGWRFSLQHLGQHNMLPDVADIPEVLVSHDPYASWLSEWLFLRTPSSLGDRRLNVPDQLPCPGLPRRRQNQVSGCRVQGRRSRSRATARRAASYVVAASRTSPRGVACAAARSWRCAVLTLILGPGRRPSAVTASSCWNHPSRSTPIPRLTLASVWSSSRHMCCRSWLSTWRAGRGRTGDSSDATAPRCGETPCGWRSSVPGAGRVCQASGFMIMPTPALCRRRHNHDLRHTGNTLTAIAGASLRELMDRMGHRSPRAALIYLHGSDARQRAIADGLNRLVEGELRGRVQGRPKSARRRDRARGGHASNGEAS